MIKFTKDSTKKLNFKLNETLTPDNKYYFIINTPYNQYSFPAMLEGTSELSVEIPALNKISTEILNGNYESGLISYNGTESTSIWTDQVLMEIYTEDEIKSILNEYNKATKPIIVEECECEENLGISKPYKDGVQPKKVAKEFKTSEKDNDLKESLLPKWFTGNK